MTSLSSRGKVTVDFRAGKFTFKAKCNWRATMANGKITGSILDIFEMMEKTGFDTMAAILPSSLPFTLHYYR